MCSVLFDWFRCVRTNCECVWNSCWNWVGQRLRNQIGTAFCFSLHFSAFALASSSGFSLVLGSVQRLAWRFANKHTQNHAHYNQPTLESNAGRIEGILCKRKIWCMRSTRIENKTALSNLACSHLITSRKCGRKKDTRRERQRLIEEKKTWFRFINFIFSCKYLSLVVHATVYLSFSHSLAHLLRVYRFNFTLRSAWEQELRIWLIVSLSGQASGVSDSKMLSTNELKNRIYWISLCGRHRHNSHSARRGRHFSSFCFLFVQFTICTIVVGTRTNGRNLWWHAMPLDWNVYMCVSYFCINKIFGFICARYASLQIQVDAQQIPFQHQFNWYTNAHRAHGFCSHNEWMSRGLVCVWSVFSCCRRTNIESSTIYELNSSPYRMIHEKKTGGGNNNYYNWRNTKYFGVVIVIMMWLWLICVLGL